MAEVLGAVASGLAVAEVGLKVGGTVWKLRRLWQQIHDVPETIQDLMRQIEMMDPILSDHEANVGIQSTALLRQLPTYNAAPAMQSTAYCREALGDLRRLVDDLDGAVESEKRSRRTVARMRVVLKKDTIKGFQDRLERAIRFLQWTQVNYLVANATITGAMLADIWTSITTIQSQQNLTLQQISNINLGRSPFPVVIQHDATSQEHTIDRRKKVQRQHQGNRTSIPWSGPSIFGTIVVRRSEVNSARQATYAARIQLPKWLSKKVWEISINRACSGWQGSISTWNVVSEDSPGMLCVKHGDLDGLFDLFDRGLASPQDCDVNGQTIFNIACFFSHTHIVKHFINMNLDITNTMTMDTWALSRILQGTMPIDIIRQLSSRGSFHSLANAAEDFLQFQDETMLWSISHLSSGYCLSSASQRQELFEFCLRTYFPFWNDLPPRRKQFILMFDLTTGNWTADGLRHIICPDGVIRPIDTKAWNDDGASLLHPIFLKYLLHSFVTADSGKFKTLLKEAIQATDDVHRTFYSTLAPHFIEGPFSALQEALMALMKLTFVWPGFPFEKLTVRGRLERMAVALQSLVSVIASCGYDLLKFGRQEAVKWVGQRSTDSIAGDALYLGIRYDEVCNVSAVHYGAEPRDWYLVLDHHYEGYAEAFWNLIENPHLFMVPGAWVNEE